MRILLIVLWLLVCGAAGVLPGCLAQAPAPEKPVVVAPAPVEVTPKVGFEAGSTYTSLDVAAADLAYEKEKNLNLQSQLLRDQYQQQVNSMQQQYAELEKARQAVVDKIKKNNGFGDDTTYDPEKGKWFKQEKPKDAPKVDAKPAAK